MSWCTVADIGGAAGIRHVKIAQQVWESYVGANTLYVPSASWELTRHVRESVDRSEWSMGVNFRCISISEIKLYRHGRLVATVSSVEADGRMALFDKPAGLNEYDHFGVVVTGVRGTASLEDLSLGDDLVAGQSVLRSGAVVLIEQDATAEANDQLIVPPDILRSAALTVGRRVIQMEQDQQATFDDASYGGGGIGNRLVDGWIAPVQEFLK